MEVSSAFLSSRESCSFATYNCNSLLSNIPLIKTFDFDVLALQEIRIQSRHLGFVRSAVSAASYNFFTSSFPEEEQRVNKLFAGIGFLVRDCIPADLVDDCPILAPWISKGYVTIIRCFLQGRWITFLSAYCPQGNEHDPCLNNVFDFLTSGVYPEIVVLGDFNEDVKSATLQSFIRSGSIRSLTAETGVDFHTYRSNTRGGWTTTSIDHGPVREQSYDLKVFWPREQGHAVVACTVCLCTPMQSRCQIVVPPSLQVHVPDVDWPLLLPGTAFAMWDAFAARVSSFVPGCVSKGSFPKFKVRDDFRYSQVAEKVREAIIQEDYASCNLLLKDLNRISSRMLAN